MTLSGKVQLFAFCVFEACVGVFWPSIMKLRSQYVPEGSRSTILNFFRIPVNIFVCVVLYNVSYFIYFLFAKKSLKYLAFLFAQWFLSFSVFFSNALGQTLNEQHTVNLSVISQLYGQYVLVFSISGVNQVFGEITKTRAFGEIKKNLPSVFQNLPPYLMTLEVPLKGKCLFQVNAFPITIMFGMCAIFLVMASVLQHRFMVAAEKHKSGKAQYVSCTRQAYRRQHIAVLLHSFILINGF